MQTCKCEHWQQCPTCMPHRFDDDGNVLPPEPTPLEDCRKKLGCALEVLEQFSNYVMKEQCSTDGPVTYSTSTINHFAFLARAAIVKATGELSSPDKLG